MKPSQRRCLGSARSGLGGVGMEALLGVVALPDESWLTFSVETLLGTLTLRA